MFLLVPAYLGCPGQTAVKWLLYLANILMKQTKPEENGNRWVYIAELSLADKIK